MGIGGAEKVVYDFCVNHKQKNLFFKIVSIGKNIDRLDQFEKANLHPIILNSGRSPVEIIRVIRSLIKICKKEKISIIHAHMVHAGIIACLLKFFLPKIKVVFNAHGISVMSRFREIALWILKFQRDYDIVFSTNAKQYYNSRNIIEISNGINISDYELSLPKFPIFTFITIGRLEKVKNQILILEAAKILSTRIEREFKVIIVGKGGLDPFLNDTIEKMGLVGKVELLGLRQDISSLCNRSHAFVLSSLYEGIPVAMLEAGAAGVPVISTSVGSIPDLVKKNEGYLTGMDPQSFSNAMEEVIMNYDLAIKKSINFKEKLIREFSIEAIVNQHENLYKHVLSIN